MLVVKGWRLCKSSWKLEYWKGNHSGLWSFQTTFVWLVPFWMFRHSIPLGICRNVQWFQWYLQDLIVTFRSKFGPQSLSFPLGFHCCNWGGGGFKYCFMFIPKLGENDRIWLMFFQMGWNHQLGNFCLLYLWYIQNHLGEEVTIWFQHVSLGGGKKRALLSYPARKWRLGWDSQGKFIPLGDLIKTQAESSTAVKKRYKSTQRLVALFLVHYTSVYPAWWLYMLLKKHSWNPWRFIHQTKQHSYDWLKLLGFSSGQDQCYKLSLKIQDLQAPTKVDGWWWIYPLQSHMLHAWNIHLHEWLEFIVNVGKYQQNMVNWKMNPYHHALWKLREMYFLI